MTDVAELLVRVRSALYVAPVESLRAAVQWLEGGDASGEGRTGLIKRIEMLITSDEMVKDREATKKFADLVTLLSPLPGSGDDEETPREKPSSTKGIVTTPRTEPVEGGRFFGYRKDFKLSGSIGDNTGISYLSFIRQVEAGHRRGHSESELVDGIVKAVPSNVRLGAYLEGRDDLTLPVLQAVIRSFYQEKTATELYQELCTVSQGSKESPQDFLFRALSLRQKILFASREDPHLGYDPKLVEGQFKHACITGMANDMIRLEFRQLLDRCASDEELIEGLNAITRRQAEIERKVHGKSIAVKAVTTEVDREVLEEVRALRREVKNLQLKQSQATSGTDSGKESNRAAKRTRGKCQECQKNDDPNNRCTHCFVCGGPHLKWNCPTKNTRSAAETLPNAQGNGRGPLE